MPRIVNSPLQKAKAIHEKYQSEFRIIPGGTLLCKACNTNVSCDKAYFVDPSSNCLNFLHVFVCYQANFP